MLTKALSAAVLGLSLAALPALAQTTTPNANGAKPAAPATQPAANQNANANQNKSQPHQTASQMNLWPATKINGLNVYNQNNEKIGGINNLMMNKDGQIQMVVIGVGGFLGIGEHDVAVKYTDLKWVMEPVKSTTSANAPAGGGMARPSGTVGAAGGASTSSTAAASSQPPVWPDHAVLQNATKEQLKNMPQFDATK